MMTPSERLHALAEEHISAELAGWLEGKPPEIAEAWREHLARGHARVVASINDRAGRLDGRTLYARLEVLHLASGEWLPAFAVRLRKQEVRQAVRAVLKAPDDVSSITDPA